MFKTEVPEQIVVLDPNLQDEQYSKIVQRYKELLSDKNPKDTMMSRLFNPDEKAKTKSSLKRKSGGDPGGASSSEASGSKMAKKVTFDDHDVVFSDLSTNEDKTQLQTAKSASRIGKIIV